MIEKLERALAKYWGYDGFLPLQKEAMEAAASGRDSIVILPTGGGKSLCYQAPAVATDGLTVVVSPLIALMKDQVDALRECGVSAARLDSSLSLEEQNEALAMLRQGKLKLLYVAPERLVSDSFLRMLEGLNVSFIAIDEAHCVSMWGHDFRPEYRQLKILKERFGAAAIGAYTATATQKVREDIGEQLALRDPELIVGSFDRPNLIYKVAQRTARVDQVCEVIGRHKGESGIVYCIRRRDVDSLCSALCSRGHKALPYHAGMETEERKHNQDAFIKEEIDVIVATIAFGMGIDKSNVRYVIHTGLPKSLEHYQQESGRAGRDGLEAECCLFYSGGDYGTWKSLMGQMQGQAYDIAVSKLNDMYGYCTGGVCRHKAIVNYFGQQLERDDCGACDVCLGELDTVDNALEVGQKILSCILRIDERFGAAYTAAVLVGSQEQRILENGHDRVSTYGLLGEHHRKVVHDWIEQLVGQSYARKVGDYNTLQVTEQGWRVLKGEETPRLLTPAGKPAKKARVATESWEDVDIGLFEALRALRASIAKQKRIPAYIVFGDATLRELARFRPSSREKLLYIKGIGQAKRKQYGKAVLSTIREYCDEHGLDLDAQTD